MIWKLTDALSMFWSALDENERRLLALATVYVLAAAAAAMQARSRERLKREIVQELRG